ncbi:MAG: 4Fe-4S binding protein [Candidatus Helarchaeota archaeon]|nr:4Fe-4S binding protein [Candidatus Helarchaeota archaeon]
MKNYLNRLKAFLTGRKHKVDLKPIEINTPRARRWKILIRLAKLPIIKHIYKRYAFPDGFETQTGTPIPINVSLGTYEDQILPHIVTEYFIKKAGTILLIDCPCRTKNKCQNHDIKLGCTWLGRGAGKVDRSKWPGAHLATKEEALERERLAYENGLVPHLGKLRGDAKIYDVLDYEHEFMSICHCCSCCCVNAIVKYGPSDYKKIVKRMEGVEVRVNRDLCVGCGTCFKVCIYNGKKMINNKAIIIQENCMGCGRCERVCPHGAISISIDDFSRIDELIARFESRVDISS